ncbi:MAG: hypothetical protein IJA10_12190 [Lachnospiraceae bacterium]|nr:hypothetical protein [Lachnospiraceae bacterium]
MKKIIIEFSDVRLITPAGVSLVGQMLCKSDFIKSVITKMLTTSACRVRLKM